MHSDALVTWRTTVPVTRTNYARITHRKSYAAKRCSNGAQARRPVALIMEGYSCQDAAKAQNMDRQALRDWVHSYNELGRVEQPPEIGTESFRRPVEGRWRKGRKRTDWFAGAFRT